MLTPNKAVQFRINICFRVTKVTILMPPREAFLEEGIGQGLTGFKGHCSRKGIRPSNYNSIPLRGAEKLANFVRAFATS